MWEKVAILAVVLAFITGVIGGRKYESNKHTEELVAIQAQNEVKLKELTARKDETISLIIKSKASDAADLAALTKHVNRLQYNLSSTDRKLLRNASGANAKSVEACRQLLSESAGLHREGVELLRDLNTRLEAFIKLNSTSP